MNYKIPFFLLVAVILAMPLAIAGPIGETEGSINTGNPIGGDNGFGGDVDVPPITSFPATVSMKAGDATSLPNGKTFTLGTVTDTAISGTINPTVSLSVGGSGTYDTDSNGVYDTTITLDSITAGIASITFSSGSGYVCAGTDASCTYSGGCVACATGYTCTSRVCVAIATGNVGGGGGGGGGGGAGTTKPAVTTPATEPSALSEVLADRSAPILMEEVVSNEVAQEISTLFTPADLGMVASVPIGDLVVNKIAEQNFESKVSDIELAAAKEQAITEAAKEVIQKITETAIETKGNVDILNSLEKFEISSAETGASVIRSKIGIAITARKTVYNLELVEIIPASVAKSLSELVFVVGGQEVTLDEAINGAKTESLGSFERDGTTAYLDSNTLGKPVLIETNTGGLTVVEWVYSDPTGSAIATDGARPELIQEGPPIIVKWTFPKISKGETKQITYYVKSDVASLDTISLAGAEAGPAVTIPTATYIIAIAIVLLIAIYVIGQYKQTATKKYYKSRKRERV